MIITAFTILLRNEADRDYEQVQDFVSEKLSDPKTWLQKGLSCGRGGRRGMERVCLKRFPDSLEEYFDGKLSCQTLNFIIFF